MRHVLLPPTIEAATPSVGELIALQGATMGTGWSLRAVLPPGVSIPPVQSAVEAELDAVVRAMSNWESDSELSRYNRAAAGDWCVLSPAFFTVLRVALALAAETDGAYDPTAGALVDLWGFGPAGPIAAPPEASAIAEARVRTGWQRLRLDPDARRALQPGGVALDLSSIAKGHAVDAVSSALGALGIEHHLVEIGGELRGSGLKPDGQPWWVQLEVPEAPGLRLPDMVVALHGLAIATSGDYRQGFTHGSQRYSHTLDLRSGQPLQNDLAAVTVLHAEAMQADALATALMVLGLDEGLAFAERKGLAARFVQRTRSGLDQHLSPALRCMAD